MKRRANVFAIHPYTDAPRARRLESLLREADPALAHYTVLPERALPGSRAEVLQGIDNRLRFSTAVVVVNAPGLHVRETSTYEMIRAVEMDKRIVVVQPHQDFHLPVPAVLDGHVYRHVGWRVDAVGRA
ncbi:MAG: hypothetical protein KC492_15605, partial [Myxococcales bacterium]|nr:hypothetical protein [Myxococcales bacterium]